MRRIKFALIVGFAAMFGGCGGTSPSQPSQPVLTSIILSPSSINVQLPATRQFKATGQYNDNSSKDITQDVTWTSSNSSVVTVSNRSGSNGLATMVGSGTATVSATSQALSASAAVTVSSSVSISISPTFASVTVTHQTATFSETVQGASNIGVNWSVDGVAGGNPTLGTISNAGVYTPPSTGGFHTITVTSQADLGKTASAQVAVMDDPGVFTKHYNNGRSGENTDEIVLTPQDVNSQQFGKLFSYAVDGYVYAQPLYVANVNISGKGYHNVVYVATTNDTVYAFDADDPQVGILWQRNLVNASAGETAVPCAEEPDACSFYGPEIGITGTPVIDPSTGTLYVDTFSEIGGTYFHKLHALDITTGAEKFGGPVTIQGSVPGTGDSSDGTTVTFVPFQHLQRPGLLLANGNVYVGFASYSDVRPYHGWLFAYNATTLQPTGVFNATPDGFAGGIWQGGGGIAADATGNLYLMTGNGDFNANTGGHDYGDSFIKLSPTLSVEDYFTPYNQASLDSGDLDLGSGGPVLLPDQSGADPHLMVGAGKQGTIYLVNRDNLGHYQAGSDSQIVQSIPGAMGLVMNPPAYWNQHLYFTDWNGNLRVFDLSNDQISANPQAEAVAGNGFVTPVVSANGTKAGILWTIHGPTSTVPTTMTAYNPTDLSVFYDTNQAGTRDVPAVGLGFQEPLVINGKVYVGGQGALNIYGLLPH